MQNLLMTLGLLLCWVHASADDDVAAVVNGHKITVDKVNDYYETLLMTPSHKKISRQSALDFLVARRVSIDHAKSLGLDKDPKIVALQEDILHQALISQELEEAIGKIDVTEKEVQNYYKANPEYRTSHILFRLRALPDEEEVKQAYQAMIGIYNEAIKKPESFTELAKKHSQTINAKQGSDLGFQPSTSLSPEYYEAIKGQKVGFISKPVRSQFGLHIIKVTGQKALDEIDKNLYKKIIFDIKRDKLIADYYTKLKKAAKIKINKDKL